MSLKQGDPKNKGTFVMFKMKPREDEVPSSPRGGPSPRNPSGPVAGRSGGRTSGGEESAPLMGKRESSKKSRRAKPTEGAEDDSGCWNDCLRSHCGLRNRKMRNRLVGLHIGVEISGLVYRSVGQICSVCIGPICARVYMLERMFVYVLETMLTCALP